MNLPSWRQTNGQWPTWRHFQHFFMKAFSSLLLIILPSCWSRRSCLSPCQSTREYKGYRLQGVPFRGWPTHPWGDQPDQQLSDWHEGKMTYMKAKWLTWRQNDQHEDIFITPNQFCLHDSCRLLAVGLPSNNAFSSRPIFSSCNLQALQTFKSHVSNTSVVLKLFLNNIERALTLAPRWNW